MELGLAEKTVVVTGGASWIGRGIVLAFAREGSNVVIADIDEVQARKTADFAKKQDGKVMVIKTDVTKPEQCEAMAKKALDETGRLDVLVNSVGGLAELQLFVDKPRESLVKEIDLNYWGTYNCTRAVIDWMIAQKRGKIINIASDAGKVGAKLQTNYSAAKGAIISLTKALALEFGRYGLNVNAVCPGVILPDSLTEELGEGSMWRRGMEGYTPEWKEKMLRGCALRRRGQPEDVANLTIFLASDAASWITGQAISVNGGIVMM